MQIWDAVSLTGISLFSPSDQTVSSFFGELGWNILDSASKLPSVKTQEHLHEICLKKEAAVGAAPEPGNHFPLGHLFQDK